MVWSSSIEHKMKLYLLAHREDQGATQTILMRMLNGMESRFKGLNKRGLLRRDAGAGPLLCWQLKPAGLNNGHKGFYRKRTMREVVGCGWV